MVPTRTVITTTRIAAKIRVQARDKFKTDYILII